jgi:3-hydroxybutyrate dehydrogenase
VNYNAGCNSRPTVHTGINLEFARLLLQGGANVVFADLSLRPEAEQLVQEYQATANRALFQRTDVSSWTDLETAFKVAVTTFRSVDIVCPGAGVFEPPSSNFWYPPGTPESKDDAHGGRYKILDINLTHPIRASQLAIQYFLNAPNPCSPSNPKSIVHIASIAAQLSQVMYPMYCISKHGIQCLTRSLGDLEKSHGIRVTAVEPGLVKTPLWTEDEEKLKMLNQEGDNADGWVTPEDVAKVMLACVQDSEFKSGEDVIPIRGGTCLEVATDAVRDVPEYNNIGPFALNRRGVKAGNVKKMKADTLAMLKPGWADPKQLYTD